MGFTAQQVRELRHKTGAGMLDCKNALQECGGDMEQAVVYLQKKGLADAQKRHGRATEIGRIFITHNNRRAIILELLCETDFVARNDTFIAAGNTVADALIDIDSASEREQRADGLIKQAISVIKENIRLNRHQVIPIETHQRVSHYIHGDDGSLGTLVVGRLENADAIDSAEIDRFLRDIAMHIAACRPQYLSAESVDEDYRAQQMKIFTEQAKNSGKPERVIDKIANGKLRKHLSEICLLEQKFVKEEKKSVRQILSQKGQQIDQKIDIIHFIYYKAGENEQ